MKEVDLFYRLGYLLLPIALATVIKEFNLFFSHNGFRVTNFSSVSDAYFREEDILISESHIPYLIEVLVEVSHKWEVLGIAIGLPRRVISQCKHDRHIVALNSILHEWVTGN